MSKTIKRTYIPNKITGMNITNTKHETNYNEIQKFDNFSPAYNYSELDDSSLELAQKVADIYLSCKIANTNRNYKNDPFTLAKKYQFALEKVRDKRIKELHFGATANNLNYNIENPAYRDLFIVLFTDKKFNYLNYYNLCRETAENNEMIAKVMIRRYGFYSKKLLFMELQVSKFIKHLEDTKHMDDSSVNKKKILNK